ncbi:MAG: hypothetical protein ACOY41_12885 [Pseudomonadota bacterium]
MKKLPALVLLLITVASPALAETQPAPRPQWQRVMKPLKFKKVAPAAVAPAPVIASLPSVPVSEPPKLPVIKYLGSLQRGNERYLFAEVNGKVYSVRNGGDMAGIYHLVAVGEHEARFVYLPTNENYLVYMD